jgi:hypothetical protein
MKTRRDTGFWILNPVRTIVSSVDILMLLPISRFRRAADCTRLHLPSCVKSAGDRRDALTPRQGAHDEIHHFGIRSVCEAASRTVARLFRSRVEGAAGENPAQGD